MQNEIRKYRRSRPDVRAQRLPRTDDFARLARRICGVSIGLVLGGGGARGISHLVSHVSLSHAEGPLNLDRESCARWKTTAYPSIISGVSISILPPYFRNFICFKVPVSVPSLVVYTRRRSTSYLVLLGQVNLAGDWVIYGDCYPTSHILSWPTRQ